MSEDQNTTLDASHYWAANIKLICSLLVIWFVVPFLGGIVFVEELNVYRLGGYKLGFWIAQQGSIYLFVVLIFVYAKLMNRLDDKFRKNSDQGDK